MIILVPMELSRKRGLLSTIQAYLQLAFKVRGKRQNQLTDEHITRIIETYRERSEQERCSRRVSMKEIETNDFNLNISRYVSSAQAEAEINLKDTHAQLVFIDNEKN